MSDDLAWNMATCMLELLALNNDLPKEKQLPKVLFHHLHIAIFKWVSKLSDDKKTNYKTNMNDFNGWKRKSGFNDLEFLTDGSRFTLTENQQKTIDAFEAWVLSEEMVIKEQCQVQD